MVKSSLLSIFMIILLVTGCTQPSVETPSSSPVETLPPTEAPILTPETTPSPAPTSPSESPLIPSKPQEPIPTPEPTYEKLPLDLYTQKGGRGQATAGGTFGSGEGVWLVVQLNIALPATVVEASEFFRTQVTFQVADPDGRILLARSEQADLKGQAIIAFMLPENTKAGTYEASATYNHQSSNLTDGLTFIVDPAARFTKISRSGRITQNETWSGTVYITGDLRIYDNVAVTIESGTTVFFTAHNDDQRTGREDSSKRGHPDPTFTAEYAQTHVALWGPIIAEGTEDSMIIFTSDSLAPNYADWHSINLYRDSILEHTIVEYGQILAIGEHSGNAVRVSQSVVRHILTAGVGINAPATVTHNLIYDCGHESIDVSPGSGEPIITNNILFHSRVGIFTHASPLIENNLLIDNDRGISIYAGIAIVRDNMIASPKGAPHDWTYGDFAYKAYLPHGNRSKTRGIQIGDASPTITGNVIGGHPENIEVSGNSLPILNNNYILDSIKVDSWTITSFLDE